MSLSVARETSVVEFTGTEVLVAGGPGESILFAGLRAGLPLPYECASGGCGTCRAQLVSGEVATRWEQATGLSERDRRKGDRILLCQSVAQGTCQVRATLPENAGRGSPSREPLPVRLSAQILERELLSADTARFVLVTAEPLTYLPGQFVLLEFGDGVRRAYSMSRVMSPTEPDRLELLIRAKPGGAAALRPGRDRFGADGGRALRQGVRPVPYGASGRGVRRWAAGAGPRPGRSAPAAERPRGAHRRSGRGRQRRRPTPTSACSETAWRWRTWNRTGRT